jgi:uncharacterized membrane protein YjgN (DUF898 family)
VTVFFAMVKSAPAGVGIDALREVRWQRLSISLPLLFLLGSTVYRKRRHILRRTWLNGQRFDLSGWAWGYAWQHFWSAFLVPLTLGWAAPWRASRLEQRKINEMHYGGARFHAKANVTPLYKVFALLWFGGGLMYVSTLVILSLFIGPQIMAAVTGLTLKPLADAQVLKTGATIIALGLTPLILLILVYRKVWIEHLVSSVCFDGGRLQLAIPRARYLWLTISNAAMTVLTLGAFAPVAEARYVKFMIAHLKVDGALSLRHQA